MPELPKTYSPREVEQTIYRRWEESGLFNPDKLPLAKRRRPFTISMPPPNITGELHVGHALGFTIQDLLIRYHRLRGAGALWVPGTDHAAIATQVVVERELRKEGLERHKLGRGKFLQRVWQWKERYGRRIVEQTKRLGASADWSRERFTMDEDFTLAVNTAFKRLYDDELIYRGEGITNWCPACRTSISDLEVDYEDVPSKLWYVAYPLTDGSGSITVATTRPETMLGDTAVAVHPKDARFSGLIGKTVRLPIVGREIPIIADPRIDREFGTGAVKVTPAHDALDYALGQTHRLPAPRIIGPEGRLTDEAGKEFAGLTTIEARQRVVDKLRGLGTLTKEQDYIHAVAFCSRSKTVIEPLVSKQWFVKVKPLAEKAIQAVRSGKIKIMPKRFERNYFQWMESLHDWNISRQIWWGHRLPVWYRRRHNAEEIRVSTAKPGPGWIQDIDTLDTWFSAGLWTFSTLGWPKRTSDLKRFHPTDVMETAWDILFFWVARMIMFSLYFVKEVPFKTVYLHGLVLDEHGQKMSKSKGTGVDPLVIGDRYGTDALRMSLIVGNAAGQDFRLYEKKIEGYRNFANKLWNVARFILSQPRPPGESPIRSLGDRWIDFRRRRLIDRVTLCIERFDFSSAGQALYDFVWHDFADWYVEYSKVQPNPALLYDVLETALTLLHPLMPFITEELWGRLHPGQLLMVQPWPKRRRSGASPAVKKFSGLQRTVVALRHFKLHSDLPVAAPARFVSNPTLDPVLLRALSGVATQALDRLTVAGGYDDVMLGNVRFQIQTEYVQRFEAWRQKERRLLAQYIAGLERKLTDQRFVGHAPTVVVEAERMKLVDAQRRLLEL